MIPRISKTVIVSYSRQALPRPARLYSTPSKPVQAPASAQASVPHPDYPAFLPHERPLNDSSKNMYSFLRRRMPYTLLPTPLPDDKSSALNDFYFTDSPTQDSLAIIDACLHNLYDVPRARQVFERMRRKKVVSPNLHVGVYNSILEAYVEMATKKEPDDRSVWIEMAKDLYQAMQHGKEVLPNATTYALMLMIWRR
jgi:DNA-directed RNA polymerase, mitochondrial